MKTLTFKSTRGRTFEIEMPDKYKKIKLPSFAKWVRALESGDYRQCTSALCERKASRLYYCCLGVLSKIQGRLQRDEDGDFFDVNPACTGTLSTDNPLNEILGNKGFLPDGVIVTRGMSIAHSLIDCNDSLGLSFKDIAKIIRTVYKAK